MAFSNILRLNLISSITVFIFLSSCISNHFSKTIYNQYIEREIFKLEADINKSWLSHDTATISSVVDNNWHSWSLKGIRRSKEDMLRSVLNNKESQTTVIDPKIAIYNNTVIYTALIIDKIKPDSKFSTEIKTCITDIFVRIGKKWQLVGSHTSKL